MNLNVLGLNISTDTRSQYISQHPMSGYWWISLTFNVIGTMVNGFVLYIFIQERRNILFGVNAMIWLVFNRQSTRAEAEIKTSVVNIFT